MRYLKNYYINMKKVLFIAVLIMICAAISAQDQKAEITFKEKTYNFGTFSEELGKVTTEFEFTNTGSAPLLITRTAASCGCTTPEYPKEPIAPGKNGKISVTYNATGRPGSFAKTVYVFANTDPEKTSLVIKGNVNPKEASKEDQYPRQISKNLRINDRNLPFFDVYIDTPKTQTLGVLNTSEKEMEIEFYNVPKHVSVKMSPSKLAPGEEGTVEVTYNAGKAKDWGMKRDFFCVNYVGQERDDILNKVNISADIRENFEMLSEKELTEAPVFNASSTSLNFGVVKNKSSRSITLQNDGKSKLLIRKIKNDSRSIICDLPKTSLNPGETMDLTVTVDPGKADSRSINDRIYIITNAPGNPSLSFKVLGVID